MKSISIRWNGVGGCVHSWRNLWRVLGIESWILGRFTIQDLTPDLPHIVGPDDVIEQPDELTALREANALNRVIDSNIDKNLPFALHVVALVKNAAIEDV
jgi:hypothetical protein